jgi:hypothetical protein
VQAVRQNDGNVLDTQSMLVKSIRATAAFFKDLPGVLGYEPFNEPDSVGINDYSFEHDYLGPFYKNVISEISEADKAAFVFIEPRVDWTVFKRPCQIKTYLPLNFPGNKTVFSFHYYDSRTALLADAFRIADDMSGKEELWSKIFKKTIQAAK